MNFCAKETDSYNFTDPFLTNEGDLIFSSDMPDGFGGFDLWIAQWNSTSSEWKPPANLGPGINSAFDEKSPTQTDPNALYFSSNRPEGMGGYDLFCAANLYGEHVSISNFKIPVKYRAK